MTSFPPARNNPNLLGSLHKWHRAYALSGQVDRSQTFRMDGLHNANQLQKPSISHQPNSKFERDPNASHPGPSTLALGFSLSSQLALSSGTVLFFENFHGRLAFEGRFFAAQASAHVLMFGASLANGFATGRGAIAQSGCLTCGSLLAYQRRQSATGHRHVNCPSFGSQCPCGRWQANAQ